MTVLEGSAVSSQGRASKALAEDHIKAQAEYPRRTSDGAL